MPMEKTIHWYVDADEMIKIHAAGSEAAGLKKPLTLIVLLLMEITGVLSLFSIVSSPGIDWWHAIIPFILTLIVPFFLIYQYWYMPRQMRALFQKRKKLAGEYTLTFTDDHYLVHGPNGESKVSRHEFLRWKQAGDYFFLFQSGGLVNYLPKNKPDPEMLEFIYRKIAENQTPKKISAPSRIFHIPIAVLIAVLVIILIIWNIQNAAPR